MDRNNDQKKKHRKPIIRLIRKFFVDIVPKRKTEPTFFHVIKFVFIYLVYLGTLAYLIHLILKFVEEVPHLTTFVKPEESIPAPVFGFVGAFDFNVTCNFLNNEYDVINSNDGKKCVDFLKEVSIDGSTVHFFDIIDEPELSLNDRPVWSSSGIYIFLFDASFYDTVFKKGGTSEVYDESLYSNMYLVPRNQRSIVRYNRVINKDLDGHKFRNRLGTAAKPSKYMVINTKIQSVSPFDASSFKYYATLEIYYDHRLVTEHEQVREKTILSILSSLGGGFSLGMAVYAFCFGAPQIGPWGWAQEVYGCRHRLKVKLSENFQDFIPLVDENPEYKDLGVSDSDRITTLERRSQALELLLKEYVMDVGDLYDLTNSHRKQQETL
ncbi:6433_t:CDS:10 [Ambispora gerdemannii]|uniref:6433_t:CDS:1 n=1 Tax=Ambispora gerdemannii TaxID=144530 RepID=A0A9N9D9J4_9GLOM|nr:6433_t:CDS:10 [Ambispora gerdemannii]